VGSEAGAAHEISTLQKRFFHYGNHSNVMELSPFAYFVWREILPSVSSECAGRQDLVHGSGTLPYQNETSFGKTDSWNSNNDRRHHVPECPWRCVQWFTFYDLRDNCHNVFGRRANIYGGNTENHLGRKIRADEIEQTHKQ
jgi:hypothetical protein